jgi:hypothetical protein
MGMFHISSKGLEGISHIRHKIIYHFLHKFVKDISCFAFWFISMYCTRLNWFIFLKWMDGVSLCCALIRIRLQLFHK